MIWRPPRIEVEFWGVSSRGVFALEPYRVSPAAREPLGIPRSLLDLDVYRGPWQFRYSYGRRIGDATDWKLVPGSVTEFLTEDPRDRILVVGNIGLVVPAQAQVQYQVDGGDSDNNAYDSDEDDDEAGGDDGEEPIYSAP
ncbi:hypothetical protein MAPG_01595 [Magnaporthiopsis poae ATCC 64411]|uniref:Uncharacterized protein n=1 Tax=Magnaporthiopsis poae (strain ATCC 64411 / 73-15) TaxID=644358 RepID=A0A0C4DP42_MAGP6|nr:hypothetical protein MAPG_01595 [Magnaporthiopsis poae ATCC 64411]